MNCVDATRREGRGGGGLGFVTDLRNEKQRWAQYEKQHAGPTGGITDLSGRGVDMQ